MPFFQKKPVIIEARQLTEENAGEIVEWINSSVPVCSRYYKTRRACERLSGFDDVNLLIPTLEGPHVALVGDYIIKGVKGEFYPCKPDIFEMTYQALLTTTQENNNG